MPISLPRELQKRTQKSMVFNRLFKGFWLQLDPQVGTKLDNFGNIWRAFSRFCSQPWSTWLQAGSQTSQSTLQTSIFFDFYRFFIHFWTQCLQNVIDNFSGNSAVQPVSEKSQFKLFSTFLQKLFHNAFHIRGSSSKIAKLRGPAVTREASSIS